MTRTSYLVSCLWLLKPVTFQFSDWSGHKNLQCRKASLTRYMKYCEIHSECLHILFCQWPAIFVSLLFKIDCTIKTIPLFKRTNKSRLSWVSLLFWSVGQAISFSGSSLRIVIMLRLVTERRCGKCRGPIKTVFKSPNAKESIKKVGFQKSAQLSMNRPTFVKHTQHRSPFDEWWVYTWLGQQKDRDKNNNKDNYF